MEAVSKVVPCSYTLGTCKQCLSEFEGRAGSKIY